MSLYGGITLPGVPDFENIRRLDLLCIPMISRMERCGVAIDLPYLADLGSQISLEMAGLQRDISNYIPADALDRFVSGDLDEDGESQIEINANSAPQIRELLFSLLGVGRGRDLKQTGGGLVSTGKKTLELCREDHPVVPLVLAYRERSKLKSAFCDSLPKFARFHPRGPSCPVCELSHATAHHRIHGQILTTRAETGRLSMKRPNLQQIPKRSALGRRIRAAFIAPLGRRLLSVDFSQMELRDLAHLANAKSMIEVYWAGQDIHTFTACRAFDLDVNHYSGLAAREHSLVGTEKQEWATFSQDNRLPSKNLNFMICIAGGQQVLTDHGMIPIQHVSCHDKVWDGVEFVAHEGVIFKGIQRVINYDGIAATPGHKVWVEEDGAAMELSEAVAQGRRIAVSGSTERTIDRSDCIVQKALSGERIPYGNSVLRAMRQSALRFSGQHPGREEFELQMRALLQGPSRGGSRGTLPRDRSALQQPENRQLEELRRQRDSEPFRVLRAFHHVGPEELAARIISWRRHRSERQRWPLRAGEPGFGNQKSKPFEYPSFEAPVYDILNAGPRRRFTVEGKLVSNCYGASWRGLQAQLALSGIFWDEAECKDFIARWFALYPEVEEYLALQEYRARRYGVVWTPCGRIRRVPEMRSCHPYKRSEGVRQAGNMPIQGCNAEQTKLVMGELEEEYVRMRADGIDVEALLPIHDEIISEVDEESAECIGTVKASVFQNVMVDKQTGQSLWRVPIGADYSIKERWAKVA